MSLPVLSVVVPCFNEELVLSETLGRLTEVIHNLATNEKIHSSSYILFVDDGSTDNTWKLINDLHVKNPLCKGLKLSRNFGHQNALIAGLNNTKDADIVITVDADLQDDPLAIKEMINKYYEGCDVVYGVRNNRSADKLFKKLTAMFFYRLLEWMGIELVRNHADYRLLSRRAIEALNEFKEVNLFIRGTIPLIGFNSGIVYYKRSGRFAGKSKYSMVKMISLAWKGMAGLSIKPLRFVTFCGFSVFFISILLTIYALVSYFYLNARPGWASIVLPVYFIGGVQLLCIGIIGEYIAKIYSEVKQRPRFIIETFLK